MAANETLMEEGIMDRRVARTRSLLHETMMSLLMKKPYEAITVGDICDTANIGRSTFYSHYSGKEDLMRAGLDHLRAMLTERQREALTCDGDAKRFGFSLFLFEHARDQMNLHSALAGGGTVALGIVREIVSDLVRNELAATEESGSKDSTPRELVVQYIVGAFMAVLTWWLDGKTRLPAERIDDMFRHFTSNGIWPAHSRPE